jgi:hypothetical protein
VDVGSIFLFLFVGFEGRKKMQSGRIWGEGPVEESVVDKRAVRDLCCMVVGLQRHDGRTSVLQQCTRACYYHSFGDQPRALSMVTVGFSLVVHIPSHQMMRQKFGDGEVKPPSILRRKRTTRWKMPKIYKFLVSVHHPLRPVSTYCRKSRSYGGTMTRNLLIAAGVALLRIIFCNLPRRHRFNLRFPAQSNAPHD